MELTLDQALQKGIEAHKAGQVQDADRYYTAILKANPNHPDANHNMGVLAVGVGKVEAALPFFKTALEVNPNMTQFWLSYIDALIKLNRLDDAKAVFDQAKSSGAKGDGFDQLEKRLATFHKKTINEKAQDPPQDQLDSLVKLYTKGQYQDALNESKKLLIKFYNSTLLYNIIGAVSEGLGKLNEAIEAYERAIAIEPENAEAFFNMGNAIKKQGKLGDAIQAYKTALFIKPDIPEAYYNMGIALQQQGKLEEAIEAFKQALAIKRDYADAYWALSGTAKNISESKKWVEKCLEANPDHLKAKLNMVALKYFENDKSEFNEVLKSSLKDHPYTRSFIWAFSLPKLPTLHFNRWALFDHMVSLSKKERPFYEFGVWRAEAFRYLIKTFKKGYGFDTFEGIPEDWHDEKAGTYSSDGNIPKIKGGKFIVGKFEDTLPDFFSEDRPRASIINFDADLYSSTICALNFAKPVIDHHTILIFDEFIINKNWEQDEYKALEEFCQTNNCTYEVLSISFFTKQVAVRLVGI